MCEFIAQHQFWIAVAVYWIYSAAVSSLPEPAKDGSPLYHVQRTGMDIAFEIVGARTVPRITTRPTCALGSRGSRRP